jgi:hypothetical protein
MINSFASLTRYFEGASVAMGQVILSGKNIRLWQKSGLLYVFFYFAAGLFCKIEK